MEYELYNTEGELTHWGIKGMRWGIRRYQNKDGTLTPAGKKRLQKETEALKKEEQVLKNRKATKAKLDRLEAKRKALDEQKKALDDADGKSKKGASDDDKPAKKSVKDMGDEELAYKIRRLQMEKQYEALTAQPETVAKGNSFVKDFLSRSAVPAIQEAGKSLIKDSMLKLGKKYLGLETENGDDYIERLGKEVKKMNLEKTYKKLKEEFAEEAAKEASKGQSDKKTKAADSDDKKTKTDDKVHEGTVEGFGTSSRTNQGQKWTKNSTVIDAEWWEVESDNSASSGRSYVSNYLSLPAPKDDD